MRKRICVKSMVLGAAIMLIGLAVGALVSCGSGDDATKSNDDDVVITPKTTEPEGDKEDKPVAVVEPTPQEPEPEPEPVLIGNPRTNEPPEPMPVDPEPQEPDPEPEPPQLDERQLAENAEREARFFLATNKERIWFGAGDYMNPAQFWDKVYQEELGFGLFFMMEVLLPILEEEQPEEKERGIFISEPFIVGYTILKFQHPDKNEDELLELFRASARAGNISIIPGQQKPLIDQAQRKVERNQQGCVPKDWIDNMNENIANFLEDFFPLPLPLLEDPDPNLNNLDKARVWWNRFDQRWDELQEQNPNMGFGESWQKASEEVFGFNGYAVDAMLSWSYREEMGIMEFGLMGHPIYVLTLEYIRLSFEFPNEDPEGLLCLFRESVRVGNVSTFEDNPKPTLGPMIPVPEPPAVEDDVFLEQARSLFNEAKEEFVKAIEENPDANDEELQDRIYKEKFGFGLFFVLLVLEPIHLEENPDQNVFPRIIFPLTIEYLRLKLAHPEKDEDALLELFRQSSRDGNISVIPPNEKPKWAGE